MGERLDAKDINQLKPPPQQHGSHRVATESDETNYLHNHYEPILSASTTSRLNVILPTFIHSERVNSFGYQDPISLPIPIQPHHHQLASPAPLRTQSSPAKVQRQTQRRFSQDSGMYRNTSPHVSDATDNQFECISRVLHLIRDK